MTPIECRACRGHGLIYVVHPSRNPELERDYPCADCAGHGLVIFLPGEKRPQPYAGRAAA